MRPTGYEPLFVLKPIGEEAWIVDGPLISFYGLPFPTRMTLFRLDGGALVVAHAGLPERLHGRVSKKTWAHALFGDTTGATDALGLPVRRDWAQHYRGDAVVIYGHTPTADVRWVNDTICIDTGCVFGGALTAVRWPEREVVQVPAREAYYVPAAMLSVDG